MNFLTVTLPVTCRVSIDSVWTSSNVWGAIDTREFWQCHNSETSCISENGQCASWYSHSQRPSQITNKFRHFFFPVASQPPGGSWPLHSWGFYITHNDAPQSVGLLWTSHRQTSTWQHTQHSQQTDIHAPGGIRNHNLSRRAAADLHLRPRGHWDLQI